MEKSCENCKWYNIVLAKAEPCCNCSGYDCVCGDNCDEFSMWKPKEDFSNVVDERRERFAFEFAKIMLEGGKIFIAEKSVELADELIKELDK